MDEGDLKIIRSYLIGRVFIAIVLAGAVVASIYFLGTEMLDENDSNDALNAILGALTLALGQALTNVVGAMSRDITEHLERMKSIKTADDSTK